jgi:hypothetical protein
MLLLHRVHVHRTPLTAASSLRKGVRRCVPTALCAAAIGLVAALPTASAAPVSPPETSGVIASATGNVSAGGGTSSGSSTVALSTVLPLPAGELESVFSSLPIEGGGLSEAELREAISRASEHLNPALGGLEGKLGALLAGLLERNPQATIGELVTSADGLLSTLLGKSVNAGEVLATLTPMQVTKTFEGLLSSEGIVKLLSGLSGRVSELGERGATSLQNLLTSLTAQLPPSVVGPVESEFRSALEGLSSPAQVESVVKGLVGELSLTHTKTPGELAGALGTSVSKLAEGIGTTIGALPATLLAVSTPGRKVALSLIDGVGGTGGLGGSGGGGGTPPAGSSGLTFVVSPAPVVVQNFAAPSAPAGAPAGTAAASPTGKVKIISRKVKGRTVTVLVYVPAAGRLTLTGKGVASQARNVLKAERLTVTTKLTRAAIASVRRHSHLNVQLTAAFGPLTGASSKATTLVGFRGRLR